MHFRDGELNDISAPLYGRQTNQRAEIIAAMVGINAAKRANYDEITVRLDSAYVKNAMDIWIHNWIANGWRGNITNREDFERLHSAMSDVKVYFEQIPREYNKEADRLAKEGAMRD